jgi:hypothetical protein
MSLNWKVFLLWLAFIGCLMTGLYAAGQADDQPQPESDVMPFVDLETVVADNIAAYDITIQPRLKALEDKQEEHLSRWEFAAAIKRVAELERKVAGMQKQITILHAKKVDKVK